MKFIELQNKVNEKLAAEENQYSGKHETKSALCKIINEVLKENNIAAVAEYEYNERANYVRLYLANEHGWADRRTTNYAVYIEFKTKRELKSVRYHSYFSYSNKAAFYTIKSMDFIYEDKEGTIEDWIQKQKQETQNVEDKKTAEIEKVNKYIDEHPEFVEMYKLAKKHHYYLKNEEMRWA